MDTDERNILRDVAAQVAAIAADPKMDLRRDLWRRHNSLEKTRTLVYIFAYPGDVGDAECVPRDTLRCRDEYCRELEFDLRLQAFRASMEDDQVIEPWLTVRPIYRNTGFGANAIVEHAAGSRSIHYLPALQQNGDLGRLTLPSHTLDEDASRQRWDIADETIGDILTVDRKRSPYCTPNALGGDLGILLGFDRLLYDMVDRPDWVHELIRTLCAGYTKVFDEALAAGDYSLTSGDSQTMCYAKELPDPKPNSYGIPLSRLWGFMSSQEMAGVSPEMTDEFSFRHSFPMMERFGLTAYGCCEDLTHKIGRLKRVKNLRRIGVTPWADVARCAEQIGTDYVLSWRPNPASHVSGDWDPAFIRREIREGMENARGCHVDITLKDVLTVRRETWRLKEWANIVRDTSAAFD